MKKIMAVCFMLASLNIFANCASLAGNAALALEAGSNPSKSISWDSASTILEKNAKSLVYQVELRASYSDGASSDEFPSTFYIVKANGNEKQCKIVSVELRD